MGKSEKPWTLRFLSGRAARGFAAALAAFALVAACGCVGGHASPACDTGSGEAAQTSESVDLAGLSAAAMPAWDGEHPAVDVTDLVGALDPSDAPASTEVYPDLDRLGRCGACTAIVSPDTMPTAERGSIGMVKPSGWQTARYDGLVDGGYLYNRCHLIGYQLTGENANERNLVTGTRYLNVEGMLPYEYMVADHVRDTGGRVLYRVSPLFEGNELVCRGVLMQALSLDDGGVLSFSVWCPNVQPGIEIDYADGGSHRAADTSTDLVDSNVSYVINRRSGVFHKPDCQSLGSMAEHNRQETSEAKSGLEARGLKPCGACMP